ncbi:MAG TPA: hypothetical protein VGJ32_07175 [Solirubrobacteraceae bacterium]|jgi:hypothetical protein
MRSTATAALLLLVLAAPARGDGLPVLGVDAGYTGVAGGGIRYVTLGNGARSTTLAAVRRQAGQVLNARVLPGAFTIPAVALDGSASGLSADGRTLVLIRPRASFPQARTVLAILDVPALRVRRVVRLRGDFSFDAIAPDGRLLYLIQYVSRTDPTRYVVRAYDVRARRLISAPVVDPRERGEKMRGLPQTRAASTDGRWAYTLYDGGGGEPFVHALDTRAATAVCVDLPQLAGRADLGRLRLVRKPGKLSVVAGRGSVVEIDTRTFSVRRPTPRHEATVARDAGRPWLPVAGVLAAAGALAAGALHRRRRVAVAAVRAR